jgi:hypothetical protein
VLGVLWFRLHQRELDLDRKKKKNSHEIYFRLSTAKGWWKPVIFLFVIAYALFNFTVFFSAPALHLLEDTANEGKQRQGWILLAVVGGLALLGYLYFVVIFGGADTWYYDFGTRYRGLEDRDMWQARWKNGFPIASLKQAEDSELRGDQHKLIPQTGNLQYLDFARLASVRFQVVKEMTLGGDIHELERVQSRGCRVTITSRILDNKAV